MKKLATALAVTTLLSTSAFADQVYITKDTSGSKYYIEATTFTVYADSYAGLVTRDYGDHVYRYYAGIEKTSCQNKTGNLYVKEKAEDKWNFDTVVNTNATSVGDLLSKVMCDAGKMFEDKQKKKAAAKKTEQQI